MTDPWLVDHITIDFENGESGVRYGASDEDTRSIGAKGRRDK
jgi:hypothetical protein